MAQRSNNSDLAARTVEEFPMELRNLLEEYAGRPVLVTNRNMRAVHYSVEFAAQHELGIDDLIGLGPGVIIGDIDEDDLEQIHHHFAIGDRFSGTAKIKIRSGHLIHTNYEFLPIRTEDERPEYWLVVTRVIGTSMGSEAADEDRGP